MRELMIGIICAVKLMARVPCCPICYSLIREPVVLPCHHEVCRDCFDHSLKTANFCCPLCRKRVSSWARRHAKDPVDHRRKRELEERFQKLQEDTTLYSATDAEWRPTICEPGEIQKEYLREVEKVKMERIEEESQGEGEARRLQQDEEEMAEKWWLDRRSEELLGEKTARCLCEEEEHRKEALRLQQQEDERLALALSQEFIQHKLETERKQKQQDRHLAEKLNQLYNGTESPSNDDAHRTPTSGLSGKKQSKCRAVKLNSPKSSPHLAGLKPITTWFKQTTSVMMMSQDTTCSECSGGGEPRKSGNCNCCYSHLEVDPQDTATGGVHVATRHSSCVTSDGSIPLS